MAKRQIKVDPGQLINYQESLQNLSFIMKNGSVFLAHVLQIKSDDVKLKNTKGHTLHLPLSEIEEIWAEEKAD